jgi:polyisoprenoid-binding protein YceI
MTFHKRLLHCVISAGMIACLWPSSNLLNAEASAGDAYTIDPSHSHVGFAVKHFGVSHVRGRFDDVSGSIVYNDKDVSKSSVEITIATASIDTDHEKRDADLKGEQFLDVENHPHITFKSTRVEKTGDGEFNVVGNLTIRGVTKEASFPFSLVGPLKDPMGMTRLGAEASLKIDRQDYGVKFNKVMDNGGLLVGNTVKIDLSVEATKR